jgi:hypothetical protein
MSSDQNARLDAALEYATRGWQTLPIHSSAEARCSCGEGCSRPGKHPRTPHGVKDATVDADIIRSWWAQWPDANVAIATGTASGIIVLDVDGTAGIESLHDLEAQHGVLLDGPRVRTGGGGRHIYLKHPGGVVRNRVGLAPGLDLRADGGYVVAPPSVHVSGGVYAWLTSPEADLPPAPEWLLQLASARRGQDEPAAAQPASTSHTSHEGAAGTTTPYGAAALRDAAERVRTAPEGTRNNTLFTQAAAAFELVAGGEIALADALREMTAASRTAGLPDDEYERTMSSAWDHGAVQPRRAPGSPPAAGSPPDPDTSEVPRWRRVLIPASEFGLGAVVETQWAVEELWPLDAWGMISGWKGCFKSYTSTDLALALASGQPFGSRIVLRPFRVLLVSEELTTSELLQRVEYLAAARGLVWRDLPLVLGASTGIRLDDASWQPDLRAAVASYRPDFMIWDPFARLFLGDENSAHDVGRVTGYLDSLRRDFGARAIIAHHDRKPARAKSGDTQATDWSDAARGSGDLIAWARTYWHIRRVTGGEDGPLKIKIRHTNAPAPPLIDLTVEIDSIEGTAQVRLGGGGMDGLVGTVLGLLRRSGKEGITVTAIRKATGRNAEHVMRALNDLQHRDLVGCSTGAWGEVGARYSANASPSASPSGLQNGLEVAAESALADSSGTSQACGTDSETDSRRTPPVPGGDGLKSVPHRGSPGGSPSPQDPLNAVGDEALSRPSVAQASPGSPEHDRTARPPWGVGKDEATADSARADVAAPPAKEAPPSSAEMDGPDEPAATLSPEEAEVLAPLVRLWIWRVKLGLPPTSSRTPPVPAPPAAPLPPAQTTPADASAAADTRTRLAIMFIERVKAGLVPGWSAGES